jgi:hypothetical protein
MFTACSVYPNLRHVRFCSLAFQKITLANGVNFRALFTHPQTKPRAWNTASTPPNPLQKPPKNTVMWNTEKYAAWYERFSSAQAWRSE